MVTPMLKSQRGNSITAARIYNGLKGRGYNIDLLSLDEPDWQEKLDRCKDNGSYALVHGFHTLHFAAAAGHGAIKNLPLLLTATGTDINNDLTGPFREDVLGTLWRADVIVVFNPDMCSLLAGVEPSLESRLAIIPQGVDLPLSPEISRMDLGLPEDDLVFILPSGLRPVKNIDLALDGLIEARKVSPRISLLIAGAVIDNGYAASIKKRIKDLPWVQYLGEVSHSSIGGIMRAADVVLNTSLSEGQPQAVLEAMSLDKPCIMTAVTGNTGIICDGVHGFYIANARELADAVLRFLNDPRRRDEMGRAAGQLVNDRYTAEKEINAYADLYDALLV